jgi:hypothetical protein
VACQEVRGDKALFRGKEVSKLKSVHHKPIELAGGIGDSQRLEKRKRR